MKIYRFLAYSEFFANLHLPACLKRANARLIQQAWLGLGLAYAICYPDSLGLHKTSMDLRLLIQK